MEKISNAINNFYIQNLQLYQDNPIKLIPLIIDIAIVIFLAIQLLKIVKDSRAWQLVKGILLLVIANGLSAILHLNILHFILSAVMNWGVILLIIIFQPELRRALEQLGTNKYTRFFGIENDIVTKTKEDIYKIVIAATELAKVKKGALIVIERDIEIKDIIATGVRIDGEVSPQLLVNIFEPNTPLHDGAVVIGKNKIEAAACMLPLSQDKNISTALGTRHRAAIGMSNESDSIVVVVSEETGKISVAKDGNLIADVREDSLKKILISNVITKRFVAQEQPQDKFKKLKNAVTSKMKKNKTTNNEENK